MKLSLLTRLCLWWVYFFVLDMALNCLFCCLNLERKVVSSVEEDFQTWIEKRNAGWYLLSNRQYEWYLNEYLNKVGEERKEQREDEMV